VTAADTPALMHGDGIAVVTHRANKVRVICFWRPPVRLQAVLREVKVADWEAYFGVDFVGGSPAGTTGVVKAVQGEGQAVRQSSKLGEARAASLVACLAKQIGKFFTLLVPPDQLIEVDRVRSACYAEHA